MPYQYRAKPPTAREQMLAVELEKARTEIRVLREELDRKGKTKRKLHPGNGDFGPEAFRREFLREYSKAILQPAPIHYDPTTDPTHPMNLQAKEEVA